jgi:hypothetical protein
VDDIGARLAVENVVEEVGQVAGSAGGESAYRRTAGISRIDAARAVNVVMGSSCWLGFGD